MRLITTPVLLGACLLGPGCSFVQCIRQNLVNEPKVLLDEKIIVERHERLGKLAWEEMVRQYGCQFSEDYRDGFIDGFVDYLTYGGCTGDTGCESPLVPAVPPPQYRRAKAMSPAGLRGAEEWFMGFRHGSNTAMASGLRQLVVVPVFDRPNPSLETAPGRFQSMQGGTNQAPAPAAPPGPPPQPPPAEGEALPPPRPVPPADAGAKPPAAPPVNPAPAAPPPGP